VYESAYDSVHDLLPKVPRKIFIFVLRFDRLLSWVSDEELDPYLVRARIVHGIFRRFVRRFGHV
jgi:hypothetical protein